MQKKEEWERKGFTTITYAEKEVPFCGLIK